MEQLHTIGIVFDTTKAESGLKRLQEQTNLTKQVIEKTSGFSGLEKSALVAQDKVKGIGESAKTAAKDADLLEKEYVSAFDSIKAKVGLITTALVGLGGMASGIMVGADFEKQMNKVGVLAGAVDEEFKRLNQTAQDLGATSAFSAIQVGEEMEMLAAGGMNVNQILGATPGVLNLASASSESLALSAEVAAGSLNAFGLDASKAGDLAHLYTKGLNTSALSLQDMKDAVANAGATFKSNNQNVFELTTAIALLKNSMISGSTGAVGLSSGMASIISPSREAKKAIEDLGLKVADSQGNIKPLSVIIEELNGLMDGFTQERKAITLETLFGKDNIKVFNVLLNASKNTVKEVERDGKKVQEVTSTYKEMLKGLMAAPSEKVADVTANQMLQTWKADFDALIGSIEGLGIVFFSEISPGLRTITQDTMGFVNALYPIIPLVSNIVKGLYEFTSINLSDTISPLTSILDNISFDNGILNGLEDIFISTFEGIGESVLNLSTNIVSNFVSGLTGISFDEVKGGINSLIDGFNGLTPVVGGVVTLYGTMALAFLTPLPSILSGIAAKVLGLNQLSVSASIAAGNISLISVAALGLGAAFAGVKIGEYLYNEFEIVRGIAQEVIGDILIGYERVTTGIQVFGKEAHIIFLELKLGVIDVFNSIAGTVSNIFSDISNSITNSIGSTLEGLSKGLSYLPFAGELSQNLSSFANSLKDVESNSIISIDTSESLGSINKLKDEVVVLNTNSGNAIKSIEEVQQSLFETSTNTNKAIDETAKGLAKVVSESKKSDIEGTDKNSDKIDQEKLTYIEKLELQKKQEQAQKDQNEQERKLFKEAQEQRDMEINKIVEFNDELSNELDNRIKVYEKYIDTIKPLMDEAEKKYSTLDTARDKLNTSKLSKFEQSTYTSTKTSKDADQGLLLATSDSLASANSKLYQIELQRKNLGLDEYQSKVNTLTQEYAPIIAQELAQKEVNLKLEQELINLQRSVEISSLTKTQQDYVNTLREYGLEIGSLKIKETELSKARNTGNDRINQLKEEVTLLHLTDDAKEQYKLLNGVIDEGQRKELLALNEKKKGWEEYRNQIDKVSSTTSDYFAKFMTGQASFKDTLKGLQQEFLKMSSESLSKRLKASMEKSFLGDKATPENKLSNDLKSAQDFLKGTGESLISYSTKFEGNISKATVEVGNKLSTEMSKVNVSFNQFATEISKFTNEIEKLKLAKEEIANQNKIIEKNRKLDEKDYITDFSQNNSNNNVGIQQSSPAKSELDNKIDISRQKFVKVSDEVVNAIQKVAKEFNMSSVQLAKMAALESSYKTSDNEGTYQGLMQLSADVASKYGAQNRLNAEQSLRAAAKYWQDNQKEMSKFFSGWKEGMSKLNLGEGIPMWMSHNQGAKGISEILKSAMGQGDLSDIREKKIKANLHDGQGKNLQDTELAKFYLDQWRKDWANLPLPSQFKDEFIKAGSQVGTTIKKDIETTKIVSTKSVPSSNLPNKNLNLNTNSGDRFITDNTIDLMSDMTNKYIQKGVKYDLGAKNIELGTIDCAGFVNLLAKTSFDKINKETGKVVFDKSAFNAVRGASIGTSHEMIQQVANKTGYLLDSKQGNFKNQLQPGMMIGMDKADHGWDRGRVTKGSQIDVNIDHIVQVITDKVTGKLSIAESASNRKNGVQLGGVKTTDLDKWMSKNANVRMFAVDPFKLAKGDGLAKLEKTSKESANTLEKHNKVLNTDINTIVQSIDSQKLFAVTSEATSVKSVDTSTQTSLAEQAITNLRTAMAQQELNAQGGVVSSSQDVQKALDQLALALNSNTTNTNIPVEQTGYNGWVNPDTLPKKGFFEGLLGGDTNIMDSITGMFSGGGGDILGSLTGGIGKMLSGEGDLMDTITSSLTGGLSSLGSGIDSMISGMMAPMSGMDMATSALSAGMSLLNGDMKGAAKGAITLAASMTPLGPLGGTIANAVMEVTGVFNDYVREAEWNVVQITGFTAEYSKGFREVKKGMFGGTKTGEEKLDNLDFINQFNELLGKTAEMVDNIQERVGIANDAIKLNLSQDSYRIEDREGAGQKKMDKLINEMNVAYAKSSINSLILASESISQAAIPAFEQGFHKVLVGAFNKASHDETWDGLLTRFVSTAGVESNAASEASNRMSKMMGDFVAANEDAIKSMDIETLTMTLQGKVKEVFGSGIGESLPTSITQPLAELFAFKLKTIIDTVQGDLSNADLLITKDLTFYETLKSTVNEFSDSGPVEDINKLITSMLGLKDTFHEAGISTDLLSKSFIGAIDSIDTLLQNTQIFSDKFVNENTRTFNKFQNSLNPISKVFSQIIDSGKDLPKTRNEFSKLVTGMTTDSSELAKTLLTNVSEFDNYYTYLEQSQEKLSSFVEELGGGPTKALSDIQEQLNIGFSELGLAVPKTREEFAALAQNLDMTTQSGVDTFASLSELAPKFNELNERMSNFGIDTTSISSLKQQINEQFKDIGPAPNTLDGFNLLAQNLDLSTEAGLRYFSALESSKPLMESLSEQVSKIFNYDASSISQSIGDAIANADSASEARMSVVQNFEQSLFKGMIDTTLNSVGQIINDAVVGPMLQASAQAANDTINSSITSANTNITSAISDANIKTTSSIQAGTAISTAGMLTGQALSNVVEHVKGVIQNMTSVMKELQGSGFLDQMKDALGQSTEIAYENFSQFTPKPIESNQSNFDDNQRNEQAKYIEEEQRRKEESAKIAEENARISEDNANKEQERLEKERDRLEKLNEFSSSINEKLLDANGLNDLQKALNDEAKANQELLKNAKEVGASLDIYNDITKLHSLNLDKINTDYAKKVEDFNLNLSKEIGITKEELSKFELSDWLDKTLEEAKQLGVSTDKVYEAYAVKLNNANKELEDSRNSFLTSLNEKSGKNLGRGEKDKVELSDWLGKSIEEAKQLGLDINLVYSSYNDALKNINDSLQKEVDEFYTKLGNEKPKTKQEQVSFDLNNWLSTTLDEANKLGADVGKVYETFNIKSELAYKELSKETGNFLDSLVDLPEFEAKSKEIEDKYKNNIETATNLGLDLALVNQNYINNQKKLDEEKSKAIAEFTNNLNEEIGTLSEIDVKKIGIEEQFKQELERAKVLGLDTNLVYEARNSRLKKVDDERIKEEEEAAKEILEKEKELNKNRLDFSKQMSLEGVDLPEITTKKNDLSTWLEENLARATELGIDPTQVTSAYDRKLSEINQLTTDFNTDIINQLGLVRLDAKELELIELDKWFKETSESARDAGGDIVNIELLSNQKRIAIIDKFAKQAQDFDYDIYTQLAKYTLPETDNLFIELENWYSEATQQAMEVGGNLGQVYDLYLLKKNEIEQGITKAFSGVKQQAGDILNSTTDLTRLTEELGFLGKTSEEVSKSLLSFSDKDLSKLANNNNKTMDEFAGDIGSFIEALASEEETAREAAKQALEEVNNLKKDMDSFRADMLKGSSSLSDNEYSIKNSKVAGLLGNKSSKDIAKEYSTKSNVDINKELSSTGLSFEEYSTSIKEYIAARKALEDEQLNKLNEYVTNLKDVTSRFIDLSNGIKDARNSITSSIESFIPKDINTKINDLGKLRDSLNFKPSQDNISKIKDYQAQVTSVAKERIDALKSEQEEAKKASDEIVNGFREMAKSFTGLAGSYREQIVSLTGNKKLSKNLGEEFNSSTDNKTKLDIAEQYKTALMSEYEEKNKVLQENFDKEKQVIEGEKEAKINAIEDARKVALDSLEKEKQLAQEVLNSIDEGINKAKDISKGYGDEIKGLQKEMGIGLTSKQELDRARMEISKVGINKDNLTNIENYRSLVMASMNEEIEARRAIDEKNKSTLDAQRKGLDEQKSALEEMRSLAKDMKGYIDNLSLDSELSILTPEERVKEARRQYEEAKSQVNPANSESVKNLQDKANTFLSEMRSFDASGSDYTTTFKDVMGTMKGFQGQLNNALSSKTVQVASLENSLLLSEQKQANTINTDIKDIQSNALNELNSMTELLSQIQVGLETEKGTLATPEKLAAKEDIINKDFDNQIKVISDSTKLQLDTLQMELTSSLQENKDTTVAKLTDMESNLTQLSSGLEEQAKIQEDKGNTQYAQFQAGIDNLVNETVLKLRDLDNSLKVMQEGLTLTYQTESRAIYNQLTPEIQSQVNFDLTNQLKLAGFDPLFLQNIELDNVRQLDSLNKDAWNFSRALTEDNQHIELVTKLGYLESMNIGINSQLGQFDILNIHMSNSEALLGQLLNKPTSINVINPISSQTDDTKKNSNLISSINTNNLPSYDVGTRSVPYDQLAQIHAGEKILDANLSSQLERYGIVVRGQGNSNEPSKTDYEIVQLLKQLIASNERLLSKINSLGGDISQPVVNAIKSQQSARRV